MQKLQVQNQSEIVALIDQLPETDFDKLRHTVRAIRDEELRKYMEEHPERFGMVLLSESSFAEDWLSLEDS